jgi:hypothetical protein
MREREAKRDASKAKHVQAEALKAIIKVLLRLF